MSNDRCRSSKFSTFSSSSSSSSSRNTSSVPVKHLDSVCNRYSQQLACDLQTTKETAVEARCRENPYMFIVEQPQTMLRTCPGQNVHLSHIDAEDTGTGRSNEVRMNYSFGAKDPTGGCKRSRAPCVTALRSPKDNEKQNGIEREPGDAGGMAHGSVSLPLPTRAAYAFTTTATLASETGANGGTTVPASDIFNYSLRDFIASVTIPPPPPPPPLHTPPLLTPPLPLPPPPPQKTTELFLDTVKKQGDSSAKQNFHESLSLAADRDRNNLKTADALLAAHCLRDGITFTSTNHRCSGDRNSPNASADLRPELSQSLSVPSSEEDDISKFVIPPPPIDILIHDSVSKLRGSLNGEDLLFIPPIVNSMVQVPSPVTPPGTPVPLSISRLPPPHPSKTRIAGRSPSLSPRPTSANSSSVSRSSCSQSPHFETFTFELGDLSSPATEQRIVEGNIGAKTRQSESTDLNQSNIIQRSNTVDSTAAAHENSNNIVDDLDGSLKTHSSTRSLAKSTPPAPPPRRLNSSVNSSPVVKRPERRVSFGYCPPSTKFLPFDGDFDNNYYYQGQMSERAGISSSKTSSFAKRLDLSPDSTEDDRRQPAWTAQIRPNALRTSGSLEFHGVLLLEDSDFPTADLSRVAPSGSVVGASPTSKASASMFAAIRSRLKTYWSPAMPRRRTPLRENDQFNRPSSAGWSSTTSFDFEQEESSGGGDDPKGRGNPRRAGDPNKNRFSLVIDSTLDAEDDNNIEFHPEKKRSIQNTFNSFTGQ